MNIRILKDIPLTWYYQACTVQSTAAVKYPAIDKRMEFD